MPHSTYARMKIIEHPLANGEMIVKRSKYNGKMGEDTKEFEQDYKDCILVRIIKRASFMSRENVNKFLPGRLLIIHQDAGEFLAKISEIEDRHYRLISEDDVIVYGRPISG